MKKEELIKKIEEALKDCKKQLKYDGISDSEWERFRGEERAYKKILIIINEEI